MKTIEQQLSKYASYHRDSRNIATHFVGIPLIVLAIVVLLSRPGTLLQAWWLSPALPAAMAAAAYYLRLDRPLGVMMSVLLGLAVWFGAWSAAQSTAAWLVLGVGGFVVGWVVQFVGHAWEGRKPAFVDDLMGLIIGPLFVAAELIFLLGFRNELRQTVETNAGLIRRSAPARTQSEARR